MEFYFFFRFLFFLKNRHTWSSQARNSHIRDFCFFFLFLDIMKTYIHVCTYVKPQSTSFFLYLKLNIILASLLLLLLLLNVLNIIPMSSTFDISFFFRNHSLITRLVSCLFMKKYKEEKIGFFLERIWKFLINWFWCFRKDFFHHPFPGLFFCF